MGKDATDEYMEENNQRAIVFGKALRKYFPKIDFYIPGDHDEFVCVAFRRGYLNEKQILSVDCEIINSRHFIIAWSPDGFISNGMKIEIDHSDLHNIPVIIVRDTTDAFGKINNHLDTLKR